MKWKVALIFVIVLALAVGFILMRPTKKQNIQVNNSTCPVSGKPVNDNHTYVHEGKEYKLCSNECKQPLSENPEKYLND